jgi:plastocyanin
LISHLGPAPREREDGVKNLRTIPLFLLVLVIAGLFGAACGDDDEGGGNGGEATTRPASPTEDEGENGSPTDGAGDEDSVVLEITAENTTFDETELTAPAGADVTLIYDNDDDGIDHNWSLYETPESTEALFEGPLTTGIEQVRYEFTAPEEPGTYHYHCDIHPTQMDGDFIVE